MGRRGNLYRCSLCGGFGHNRRRCGQKGEVGVAVRQPSPQQTLTPSQRDRLRNKPFYDPLLVGTPNAWLNGLPCRIVGRIEAMIHDRDLILRAMMEHVGGPGYPATHRRPNRVDRETKVVQISTRDHAKLPHYRARGGQCWRTFDGVHWYRFDPERPDDHLPPDFNRHAVAGDLRGRGLLPR